MPDTESPREKFKGLADEINLPEKSPNIVYVKHNNHIVKRFIYYSSIFILFSLIIGTSVYLAFLPVDKKNDADVNADVESVVSYPSIMEDNHEYVIAYTKDNNIWLKNIDATTAENITENNYEKIDYKYLSWLENGKLGFVEENRITEEIIVKTYDYSSKKLVEVDSFRIAEIMSFRFSPDGDYFVYIKKDGDLSTIINKDGIEEEIISISESKLISEIDILVSSDSETIVLDSDISSYELLIFNRKGDLLKDYSEISDTEKKYPMFVKNDLYYLDIDISNSLRKLNTSSAIDRLILDDFEGELLLTEGYKNNLIYKDIEGQIINLNLDDLSSSEISVGDIVDYQISEERFIYSTDNNEIIVFNNKSQEERMIIENYVEYDLLVID